MMDVYIILWFCEQCKPVRIPVKDIIECRQIGGMATHRYEKPAVKFSCLEIKK